MSSAPNALSHDRWYSFNQAHEILIEGGSSKDSVYTDQACYYVQRRCFKSESYCDYYEHFAFNQKYEQVKLEYNGLICTRVYDHSYFIRGAWSEGVKTKIEIKDRLGVTDVIELIRDRNLYKNIFNCLIQLDKYGGWEEMLYCLENVILTQRIQVLELEAYKVQQLTEENQKLKAELDKYNALKESIKQLF
jgi:hypothetical protein